jgi:hypothetical protein
MNRVKVWAYALLVLVAGAVDAVLLSRWLTDRSLAELDRELRSGVNHVDTLARLLAADAAQLAEAVARDPAIAQALASDAKDAVETAQSALQRAQGGPSVDGRSTLVAVGTRSGVVARSAGAAVHLDAEAASAIAGAAARRSERYAFVGDTLWYFAAVPVGLGSSVAIGLPIDGSWLSLARAGTGCAVTLVAEGHRPRSTLAAEDLAVVLPLAGSASAKPGQPVSGGKLGPQRPTVTAAAPLPSLTLPFATAPAVRAEAVALRGVPGASIVLSLGTAPLLAPVATYVWIALAGVVVLFLIGLAVGLAVTNEQRAIVPKELVAAADRIARGDFDARAPGLAGSLGTVASALNRAAAAAQAHGASAAVFETVPHGAAAPEIAPSRAEAVREAAPAGEEEPSRPAAPAAEALTAEPAPAPAAANETLAEAEPAPAAAPVAPTNGATEPGAGGDARWPVYSPAAEPAPERTSSWPADLGALPPPEPARARGGDPFGPPREEAPHAERASQPDSRTEDLFPLPAAQPRPTEEAAPEAAAAPAAPASAAAAVPAAGASPDADEAHWRAVYDDFVRVRAECGEGPQAVAFDRFRQKLAKNREQLVEKYRCRTVKFQVYVKEGKAALKATPVR